MLPLSAGPAVRAGHLLVGLVNCSQSLIKPLLAADLINRLYLMVFPEITGGGQRLFEGGLPASTWALTHQETGKMGEMAMVYDRAR